MEPIICSVKRVFAGPLTRYYPSRPRLPLIIFTYLGVCRGAEGRAAQTVRRSPMPPRHPSLPLRTDKSRLVLRGNPPNLWLRLNLVGRPSNFIPVVTFLLIRLSLEQEEADFLDCGLFYVLLSLAFL